MTSKTYRILLAAGMAAMLFLLGFSSAKLLPQEFYPNRQAGQALTDEQSLGYVSVVVDADNGPKAVPEIPWEEGMTAFRALQKSAEKASFNLEYKDYGGDMGVFITSIDDQTGESQKAWWQFWVNGKYADKGASTYTLNPGDSVYWTLSSQMP